MEEIKLKLDVDAYKIIKNYIHNDLKVTKQDIENMIKDLIPKVISKQLADNEYLTVIEKSIDNQVLRYIASKDTSNAWFKDKVNRSIDKYIGERIQEEIKEKLKGVSMLDLLK